MKLNGSTSAQVYYTNWTADKRSEIDIPLYLVIVFYVAGILVCVATLVGNLLVIVSFTKFPVLRTTSNYFLLSLAFADAASGPGVLLFLFINLATDFRLNKHTHLLCLLTLELNLLAFVGSVFSVMGVACERYIKVIYSLRYERLLPPQRAKHLLAFLWAFNFAISVPVFVWNRPTLDRRCNKGVFHALHFNCVLVPPVAVAILVTTALYARLFRVAWRHRCAIRALELSSTVDNDGSVAVAKKEAKLTKTACLIIGLLYASWVPYIVGGVLLAEREDLYSMAARQAFYLMLSSSSMFNPVVYQWRIPEFHAAFRKLVASLRVYQPAVRPT
ncbi:Adenosine receptor A3 [Lamellibrachia satsuma]|nr:Adenosine receptor A3 [Lamellibrachia satsuma]